MIHDIVFRRDRNGTNRIFAENFFSIIVEGNEMMIIAGYLRVKQDCKHDTWDCKPYNAEFILNTVITKFIIFFFVSFLKGP